MGAGRIAFNAWLFVNGLLMIANKLNDKPVEIMVRMSGLLSGTVNLYPFRRFADSAYTILGALYITLASHILHKGRCGSFFVILLSLVVAFTFDNPLFNDTHKREKAAMIAAHLLICITAITIGCECHEAAATEAPVQHKDKKIVKEEEEGKKQQSSGTKKKQD